MENLFIFSGQQGTVEKREMWGAVNVPLIPVLLISSQLMSLNIGEVSYP